MEISIGTYAAEEHDVPVTFMHAGVTHKRRVNACLDGAGEYDAAATAERVAEVARGVAEKIALGVITNQPETPAGGA